jgi:sugar diacid utilization regulator
MAVPVARPLKSGNGHVDLEVTLRSLVRLIEQVLPAASFGKLVDIRDGAVTAIVCSERDTARGLLAALRRNGFARRARNGLAAGVGISLDTVEIGRLPQALDEARVALDFASAGRPLMHFPDIELPEFLLRRPDPAAFRLIPEWVRHFRSDHGEPGELARTIRLFADCSFNVKRTAQRLGVHTNTAYFRLNRINKLTGVDARTYAGASLLLSALRLSEINGDTGPG